MKTKTLLRVIAVTAIAWMSAFSLRAQDGVVEIGTEAELRQYFENDPDGISGSYKLTADIELTGDWTPSWRLDEGAVLDGGGHIIKNLRIIGAKRDGMAAFITYLRGTIKNLGFENATVDAAKNTAVIVGEIKGGILDGCWVKNSSVKGTGEAVGGLAGWMSTGNAIGGEIKNCYMDGSTVTSSSNRVGGIAGGVTAAEDKPAYVTACHVTNSAVKGTGNEIVGGIVGRFSTYATMDKCYVDGVTVYGNKDTGGLVGRLHNHATITNSFSQNTLVDGNDNVGGIAGRFWTFATVENCYSSARVDARSWQAGGIVGQSAVDGSWNGTARVANTYFSGIVSRNTGNRASGIMGLIGSDVVTIEKCATLAAGIVGTERYKIASKGNRNAVLTDNYALETLTGDYNGTAEENGTAVTVADAKTQAFYETTLGWDFADTWKMTDGGYPVLKWQEEIAASLVLEDLSGEMELKVGETLDLSKVLYSGHGLAMTYATSDENLVIDGNVLSCKAGYAPERIERKEITATAAGQQPVFTVIVNVLPAGDVLPIATADEFIEYVGANQTGKFKLVADLDFAGISGFNGLDRLKGELDGQGYAIRNLTMEGGDKTALFHYMSDKAIIRNLIIDGAKVKGNNQSAILVGEMRGESLIERCAILNSTMEGNDHVGIFVGNMGGSTIQDCYSTSTLTKVSAGWAGAMVGLMDRGSGANTVFNCYNAGDLQNVNNGGGSIVGRVELQEGTVHYIQCNVGLSRTIAVNGGEKGRIAGVIETGDGKVADLADNYALSTMKVSGNVITDGAEDNKNGANIPDGDDKAMTAAFYEPLGWDFTDVWTIEEGKAFPTLKVQKSQTAVWGVQAGTPGLVEGETLDLSSIAYSYNTLAVTYTAESEAVVINGNTMSVKAGLAAPERVTVTAKIEAPVVSERTFEVLVVPAADTFVLDAAEDLEFVTSFPGKNFELAADLDLTDMAFSPLCASTPFTGTFDGKGHVIRGLKYEDKGMNGLGFIVKAEGATIKNLGIENARFVGNSSVGVIAGIVTGTDNVIEQCYVSDSYAWSNDRAAAIVGFGEGNATNVTIRNCYASDMQIEAGGQQSGGIMGANQCSVTIENCYFEGSILGGRYKAAMIGLLDADGVTVAISNNLSLVSAMSTYDGGIKAEIHRIASGGAGRVAAATFANNYSISTTTLSTDTSKPLEGEVMTAGAADDADGANLPDDNDAKSETFYKETLTWDFAGIWEMVKGYDYPVLRVFKKEPISTGVDSETAVAGYDVLVADDVLTVSGLAEGAQVVVFNVNGQQVASVAAAAGRVELRLPGKGFFAVSVVEGAQASAVKVMNK